MEKSFSPTNISLEATRTEFVVGDTILIDVKVDSKGKEINVVEGTVVLSYPPGAIMISDISLAESDFSLWTNKPTLSDDLRTISFVGGVPNGLQHQDATLFKIALNLKQAGQITLSPNNISVYLHDGKGTRDTATIQNLTLDVLPQQAGYKPINEWSVLVSEDTAPPLSFEIIVGRDGSVFSGDTFLSFGTTDEQSGVRYYEVREGDLPPVRSSGTYVLQDQNATNKVTVIAYDAAGNARESVYDPTPTISYFNFTGIVLSTALVVLLLVVIFKKRKRK